LNIERSFYGTTTPIALTNVGPYGLTIRTEAGGRLGAPISAVIKGIEEPAFARVRKFTRVHAFVPDLIAVHAQSQFCRVEIIHNAITFLFYSGCARHQCFALPRSRFARFALTPS
jgi:hypothetical protein